MSSLLLEVRQISKTFGQRTALEQVSFSVEFGQTLGLIGPNGAGKSTMVSIICGLLTADSGEVLIDGQRIGSGKDAIKQKIGLVPQDLALYEDLSAIENLKLFGALYGLSGSRLKSRCAYVLELVQLQERARELSSSFSGGMKRRLNIAAALLHDPQLLIRDEPTVGVDPQSRNAIFDTLELLQQQGRSLIYTSHYMEEVERLADHIVIIDHAKVLADESPDALYRRLPGQATLQLEWDHPPPPTLLAALGQQVGVSKIQTSSGNPRVLELTLVQNSDALTLLEWLTAQSYPPLHFSTGKAKLEDIFLTLTGRSLRE